MAKNTGFVGLGTMGKPMALNLLKAGFPLTICAHSNLAPITPPIPIADAFPRNDLLEISDFF